VLYGTLVVLIWLVLLALAGEAGQRLYVRHSRDAVARIWGDHVAAGQAADAKWVADTAADADPPPATLTPPPSAPPRTQWDSLAKPEERAQLAQQRQEVLLLCDKTGAVRESYTPDGPEPLVNWARHLAEKEPVWSVFPAKNQRDRDLLAQDAGNLFHAVCSGGPSQSREYQFPQTDGSQYAVECFFAPYPSTARPAENVAVFARESIYEEPWHRLRPHKYRDDVFSGWVVWTNNAGFRGPDIAVPKPQGVFRIACVGGSTTFEGPRNHLTYPALLQKRLREHFHTDRIEVVNCGVNAINSTGELEQFDNYLSLQPDLIVHYNFINDISNILFVLGQDSSPVDAPGRIFRALAGRSVAVRCQMPRLLIPPKRMIDDALESFTFKNQAAMMEKARAAGVEWVSCSFAYPDIRGLEASEQRCFSEIYNPFFTIASGLDCYTRVAAEYNRLLRERTERNGGRYIPVAEELSSETDCFIDACHLYANGIAKKADILFNHLQPWLAERIR